MSSLMITDGIRFSGIGFVATAIGCLAGRACGILKPWDIKTFSINVLAMSIAGTLGREFSLNTVEKDFDSKKPAIRYASLALGIAGMAAALTQKVSLGRFRWEGSSVEQISVIGTLVASSLSIYDHCILSPNNKRKAPESLEQAERLLKEFLDSRMVIETEPIIDINPLDLFKDAFYKAQRAVTFANRYGVSTTGRPIIEMLQEAETYLTNLKSKKKYEEESFAGKTGQEMLRIQRRLELGEIFFDYSQEIEWNFQWIKLHFCETPPIPEKFQKLGFYPDPVVKDLICFEYRTVAYLDGIMGRCSFFSHSTDQLLSDEDEIAWLVRNKKLFEEHGAEFYEKLMHPYS